MPFETKKHENVRVLVVDDHVLLADMLAASLTAQQGFELDAVQSIEAAFDMVAQERPYDVILVDYGLPGVNSLEGLRRMIDANAGRAVLFSGTVNRTVVELALDQGAAGFIPKTLPLRTLGNAIRIIADGDTFLPANYMRSANTVEAADFGLKPREMQVLSLLCEGMQNKEIGLELGMEEVVVKMHVKAICRKFGVGNRTQAVIAAHRNGVHKIT